MAKKDPVETRRAALYAAREDPGATASVELLRRGLADRVSLVVAKAAELTGELRIEALADDLVSAFRRLMVDPTKKDKGCLGKTAAVSALLRLDHADPGVFLEAARHRQLEPVWGGTADTAAELRGLAAEGLVACRHSEILEVLVDLLADDEKPARLGAIRALQRLTGQEASLLLRLKALHGDPDVEVVSECFSAIASLEPSGSAIPFLCRFVDAEDDAVSESAMLALGETRDDRAVTILKSRFETTLDPDRRRVILSALALSRTEQAKSFVVELVTTAPIETARAALGAIGPFLYDAALSGRVQDAVGRRDERELVELLQSF